MSLHKYRFLDLLVRYLKDIFSQDCLEYNLIIVMNYFQAVNMVTVPLSTVRLSCSTNVITTL